MTKPLLLCCMVDTVSLNKFPTLSPNLTFPISFPNSETVSTFYFKLYYFSVNVLFYDFLH